MFPIYDRHLVRNWNQRGSEAKTWLGIENVMTASSGKHHLNLKVAVDEFVRRRAVDQAERRGESQEILQRLERVLSPDALTIGLPAGSRLTNERI